MLRDELLAFDDRNLRPINVWGHDLFVRDIGARNGEKLADIREDDGTKWASALVVYSLVDADGKPVFAEDDIDAVAEKSNKEVWKVVKVALDINKLEPKAVDDLKKKLAPAPDLNSSAS